MAEALAPTEEAPEVSVEDRIADKLDFASEEEPTSDEPEAPEGEEAEAEPESEEEAPEFVEVEFNGQSYQVPPELKDALMRESDYTAKTTETANVRKAVELQQREIAMAQERQQFDQSVAEHVDQLKMLDAYIKHVNQNTDWASLSSEQIVRAKLEIDQLKDQKAEIEKQLNGAWNEFQAKATESRKKLQSEMDSELSKAIPKWSEVRPEIDKYVAGLGYPEVAVQNMSLLDYQVAHKAMQFDQLKRTASKSVQKATDKQGKVITPSSRKTMTQDTKSQLNYRKQLAKTKDPIKRSKIAEDRAGDKMEKLFGF